jgi:hypothetical protein
MAHKYKKKNEVISFIRKYIEHLKMLCADATAIGYRRRFPAIAYCTSVAKLLKGEFGLDDTAKGFEAPELPLSGSFWPRTNHGTGYNHSLSQYASSSVQLQGVTRILEVEWVEDVQERNTINVGKVNEKEKEAWTPLEGIKSGWSVYLNPNPEWKAENGEGWFWAVRALCKPQPYVLEEEEQPCFKAGWWRQKHVSANALDKIRYLKICSLAQAWEHDPRFPEPQWHKASSLRYS